MRQWGLDPSSSMRICDAENDIRRKQKLTRVSHSKQKSRVCIVTIRPEVLFEPGRENDERILFSDRHYERMMRTGFFIMSSCDGWLWVCWDDDWRVDFRLARIGTNGKSSNSRRSHTRGIGRTQHCSTTMPF